MNKLQQKILNQIKSKEIRPIRRYIFILKNAGFWLLAIVSMITGSISIALVSYNITSRDWDLYRHLDGSWIGFIFSNLPYLWIVLLVISLVIAVSNIEHSKKGYRYSPLKITLASVVIAILLGFAAFGLGYGDKIDQYLGSKISNYQTVESQKREVWNQPQKGLFSGTITSKENDSLIMKDFSSKSWQVDYSKATIRPRANISVGSNVKIIGTQTGNNIIKASEIRPWSSKNGNIRGHGYGRPQN